MRLTQNIGPVILAVIARNSVVRSQGVNEYTSTVANTISPAGSRMNLTRVPSQPTSYQRSSMSNCDNYNYLIESIKYKISDKSVGSNEDEHCEEMIKDQSTLEFWEEFGGQKIMEKLDNLDKQTHLQRAAKNIILFVGGGMNVDTITAARIQAGKWAAKSSSKGCGEEHELSFEKFPYTGFSKTYSLNSQTPSSRSAGTALLSGFKSKSQTLNCANTNNCKETKGIRKSPAIPHNLLAKMKFSRGVKYFKTGIVSNSQFYDGTTAAAFAKQKDKRGNSINKIADSLDQALKTKLVDLSFTGGKAMFRGSGGHDLFKNNRDGRTKTFKAIETRTEMSALTPDDFVQAGKHKPIVGMFADYELQFEDERCHDSARYGEEPSLSEMSEKAVELLAGSSKNGFFLMVEAGNVERAHQQTQAIRAINEAVELDLAIQKTIQKLESLQQSGDAKYQNIVDNTLIVVTADHGHTFTFGAWDSPRGIKASKAADKGAAAFIFDPTGYFAAGDPIAGYYAGPGKSYQDEEQKKTHPDDLDKMYQPAVEVEKTPVSAEDVPVFGKGPMAHLLAGVHEQSYVGNVMGFTACTKEFCAESHCVAANLGCDRYE